MSGLINLSLVEVVRLRYLGASTICSQLLGRDCCHGWENPGTLSMSPHAEQETVICHTDISSGKGEEREGEITAEKAPQICFFCYTSTTQQLCPTVCKHRTSPRMHQPDNVNTNDHNW